MVIRVSIFGQKIPSCFKAKNKSYTEFPRENVYRIESARFNPSFALCSFLRFLMRYPQALSFFEDRKLYFRRKESIVHTVFGLRFQNAQCSVPVNTRRRFNVYKTSRRLIDVETTSCIYWDRALCILKTEPKNSMHN